MNRPVMGAHALVPASRWWAFVHNCIAHPLLWLFSDAPWTVRLHNRSSERAWPWRGLRRAPFGMPVEERRLRVALQRIVDRLDCEDFHDDPRPCPVHMALRALADEVLS